MKKIMMSRPFFSVILLLGSILLFGCQKGFLAAKPNQSLLIPTTYSDFDALLDNENVFNISPALGLIGSDDFYTTDAGWLAFITPPERGAYTWSTDVYQGYTLVGDWNTPYQQIFYDNIILDGLNNLVPDSTTITTYNRVKGSALFGRAFALFNLTQLFAKPYDPATASQDMGVPIRLTADVNAKSGRGNLQQAYDQVISDLKAADVLLPAQALYKTRPSKMAVEALLSRVYLSMQDYSNAAAYAKSALVINNQLIDYNTLSTTIASPFPIAIPNGNNEIMYYSVLINYSYMSSSLTLADPALYQSYNANDLRKSIFFKSAANGAFTFKGNYTGKTTFFGGLATDEIYLTLAECQARTGDVNGAMANLNAVLLTRWKKGAFVLFTAVSPDDALQQILSERRKELISRGLRWTDLRRLNTDPRFAVTLNRIIQQQPYTLTPGSNHYVLPIPDYEVSLSGIPQNPR